MPYIIDQDEYKYVIQNEDGSTMQVAKDAVGPDFANRYQQPAPAMSPSPMPNPVPPPADPTVQIPNPMPAPLEIEPLGNAASAELKGPATVPAATVPAAPKPQETPTGIMDKGYGMQAQGIRQQAEAAFTKGVEQAKEIEGYNSKLQEIENRRAGLEKEREDYRLKFDEQEKASNDKVAAAANFQDYWADKSTSTKILAAVSMALGAMGQAINGGSNAAMEIINSAIKTDLERQKDKYAAAKDAKDSLLTAYGLKMKQFGDKDQALNSSADLMYKVVQNKIAAIAARADSADARAKAQQLIGQLEVSRGEHRVKSAEAAAKNFEAKRELFVPGANDFAWSKEGAQKMNELIATSSSAIDGISDLLTLSEKKGSSVSNEDRAKADTTARLVRAYLRVPVLGPGAVTETEHAIMEQIVADPTAIFSLDSTNKMRLKTLVQKLDDNVYVQGKAYGLNMPKVNRFENLGKK
jgi:hypothetical protein